MDKATSLTANENALDEILGLDEVMRRTGMSNQTLKRRERKQEFPARILIADRRIGWRRSDLERWFSQLGRREG